MPHTGPLLTRLRWWWLARQWQLAVGPHPGARARRVPVTERVDGFDALR